MTSDATARRHEVSVDTTRVSLAALLGVAAVAHVVRPRWFTSMIPAWVPGDPEQVNAAVTVVEGTAAALLATRRTARAGGWLAAIAFVGVFPANLDAALHGGYRGASGWLASEAAAWLRLPLQLPLVLAALRVARHAD